MGRAARRGACSLLAAALLLTGLAYADDPRRSVVVTVAADGVEAGQLLESVHEAVRRAGLEAAAEGAPTPRARVSVALRASEAVVVISDGEGKVLARRTLPRRSSFELLREEVALVVVQTLDAAKLSVPPAMASSAPPVVSAPLPATSAPSIPSAPPPAPPAASNAAPPVLLVPPSERDRPADVADRSGLASYARTELAAFVTARARDADHPFSAGAGAVLRVALGHGRSHGLVFTAIEAGQPYAERGADVRVEAAPLSLRTGGGLSTAVSPRVRLEACLTGGVEVLRVTTTSEASDVTARDSSVKASPIVAPWLGARVRLGPTALIGGLGVDLDFAARRYVVASPSGRDVVSSPARARPFALLGLAVPVGGGDE